MTTKKIRSIGVLCSGGDSPGMNPAIRAVVRSAIYEGLKVFSIHRGYSGLLANEIHPMDQSSVGNIIQRGGTFIQTSRCPEWMDRKYREMGAKILEMNKIDSLVVIGGDGSFNGAYHFYQEHQVPVVGIPGTIDNDITGSEYTIGFDTAVQTAIEAVDRIRDTASSHARTFLVEVMGRNSSAIAVKVGVCTGAENVIVPHQTVNLQELADDIKRGVARGKNSSIIIVAEGPVAGRSYEIQEGLQKQFGISAHVCILGHIQRGGSPVLNDRYISAQMGHLAVMALIEGKAPAVTVVQNGKVTLEKFEVCIKKNDKQGEDMMNLAKKLSI
jgi:6-phosphofructokinase 1